MDLPEPPETTPPQPTEKPDAVVTETVTDLPDSTAGEQTAAPTPEAKSPETSVKTAVDQPLNPTGDSDVGKVATTDQPATPTTDSDAGQATASAVADAQAESATKSKPDDTKTPPQKVPVADGWPKPKSHTKPQRVAGKTWFQSTRINNRFRRSSGSRGRR